MKAKLITAALCAVALTAAPAQAGGGGETLAVTLAPNLAGLASCPEGQFGFALDVGSLAGHPLGTGQTCITSSEGCDPFVAFCRTRVRATLTLDLPRGSLTLLEVWLGESSFIQAGSGVVRSGTGAFAGVTSRIAGGGRGAFDEHGNFSGRLVYVAELRR